MSKSLQIKVSAEGTNGRVDIIGSITEWNKNNAVEMRQRCQELKDSGVTALHVYLMTVGGDCFQANEIVNILIEIFGSYTGEGGAVVASAGTYIGVNASNFTMAKNGQFMIHKPMGGGYGNETELENYLQLVKNMTTTYYAAYKAVLKKPESEFKAKWDSGDFWMTAQEAVEWGFVTSVKDPVKIDKQTAAAIKNSGSPIAIAASDIYQPKSLAMDVKATAIALGMDASSTEEQVNAQIAANAQKAKDYDALKAEQDRKATAEKAAKIKAVLDKAEKDKVIKADARQKWQDAYERDFEGTEALMAGLSPVTKPLSDGMKPPTEGGTSATYEGKTFEQLQDEDPELLAELEENDPDAFNALFASWKKRNHIK